MKNTKKILPLLLLSILFQVKNVKAVSKETVEQIHFITSMITILPSIIPNINGNTKWHNIFNKYKKWENLNIKIKKPNSLKIPEDFKPYIENNISIELYAPTLFNQILAASLDKSIDLTSEIIENTKRIISFIKKTNRLFDRDKSLILSIELIITAIEITTKTISKSIITELLKKHKISKRLSKIIILSGLDFASNYIRVSIEKKIKEADPLYNVNKIVSTSLVNSIAKNIIVETLGEKIQRLFIDNEKEKKQNRLQHQINKMMKDLETRPAEIK